MEQDIMQEFFDQVVGYMTRIKAEERERIAKAAEIIADQIEKDKLIYIWGPGGHSNMNAMEVFFRAGGLMHVSAILDEGTMLSSGALRSMAIERTPGYGKIVVEDNQIGEGDLLIIANAYGINSACLDAAFTARALGATTIAVTSVGHAENIPEDHPARHPSKVNLYKACDYYIDTKVPVGDAVIEIPGIDQKMGAVSTVCNAYTLNCLMMEAAAILGKRGVQVPLWKSGNCPGGDEWNNQFIARFKGKVRLM
ncbi:MAG: SIS domain-containing protein [Lachnospiraceae bacterium]|nr:SIS domain-containing protein [Lachnospiraceae bacterium]